MTEINTKLTILEQIQDLANKLISENKDENKVTILIDSTPETWLNQSDFAKMLGISSDAVTDRIKRHLYDKPKGKEKECFYMCAKKNSACFSVRLANEYYEMNTNH